jgi:hypothetical protein
VEVANLCLAPEKKRLADFKVFREEISASYHEGASKFPPQYMTCHQHQFPFCSDELPIQEV